MAERKNTVRAYVAATPAPVRENLLAMLDDIPSVELVGVAGDLFAASRDAPQAGPDLLLLNLDIRSKAGRRMVGRVARRLSRCRVVVLQPETAAPLPHPAGTGMNAADARLTTTRMGADAEMRIRSEIQHILDEKTRTAAAPGGKGSRLAGTAREIKERRKRNAERRQEDIRRIESAARFQAFVEQLPGIAYIADLGKNGSSVYVSPRIRDLLGFTPEQWCEDTGLRLRQLHPDDRDRVSKAIVEAAGGGGYSLDYRIFDSAGRLHWLHDEAQVMADETGTSLFLQGAALDITERKQAQEALEKSHAELRELISALDMLRVEEQKRLAQEMHDDFGQLLAAMKIDLSTLQQQLPPENSQATRYLSSINELVDAMVTSVRRIVAGLPPKILEDFGLFNALESLARNFEKRHRIACRLRLPESESPLEPRIAATVYRVVQEALNNVAKHARATRVDVRIDCNQDRIALCIADNGAGMPADSMHKPHSFGLQSIRDRVACLGGEVRIESAAGAGTTIRIAIPTNPIACSGAAG